MNPYYQILTKWMEINQERLQIEISFLNHPNKLNGIGYIKASHSHSKKILQVKLAIESTKFSINKSILERSEQKYRTPNGARVQIRSQSQMNEDYSTGKSTYQQIYDEKLNQSKIINNIRSKDLRENERSKEYNYPPLPNLVSAKNAYQKQKFDNSVSVIQQNIGNSESLVDNNSNEDLNLPIADLNYQQISLVDQQSPKNNKISMKNLKVGSQIIDNKDYPVQNNISYSGVQPVSYWAGYKVDNDVEHVFRKKRFTDQQIIQQKPTSLF
ncbi:UNKNOWN [Stylonychia lemnae]|uniref:Uncharacterized protein n=1 Tax=Stylonychia lemnae TaxID=5949 RepID=A0A078BAN7_STYLE|nr:UNKNOWN [Stylonychia lemnae]|eukprot:CDW90317.1 UNKNOWN [Stylonychia lemnae]